MQEYPLALLPSKNFALKIELPASNLDSWHLIRRSLVSEEETTNDLGSVRSHAFIEPEKEHRFFGLSCNLLGIFVPQNLIYILNNKEKGGGYWIDKNKIIDVKDVEYNTALNSCPIYLQVSKIHLQPFQYEKPKANNKTLEEFTGTCKATHAPLEANYWHFEIHVLEKDGNRISSSSGKWKLEAVRHFLESYLKRHLTVKIPVAAEGIDERYYKE
jgi:hypothetical protein